MLVRNNTVCPFCGKLSATDVFVRQRYSELDLDFWEVVAECYDCLGFSSHYVHVSVLRGWIRLLADANDPVRKWSHFAREILSHQQRESLFRSFERVLPQGGVGPRSHDFPLLNRIIRFLRGESGPISGLSWSKFTSAWSCL